MTLIIGVEDGVRAFLVCDSGEWRGKERHVVSRPKIWRCEEWIVGCSGNIADTQIIRRSKLPQLSGSVSDHDVIEVLIDWSTENQKRLNEYRQMIDVVDDSKDFASGAPHVIVARGGAVFHVCVCEPTRTLQGFTVAGQSTFGYAAMHGVLQTTVYLGRSIPALELALCGMNAAYRGMDSVFGPIIWLGTDETSGYRHPFNSFESTCSIAPRWLREFAGPRVVGAVGTEPEREA